MFIISLEDLASNAFMILLRAGKLNKQRFVSYADMDVYGNGVLQALEEKQLSGRLNLGRDQTLQFLYYESEYFTEDCFDNICGLRLNDGITENDLLDRYIVCLPWKLLVAFKSDTAVKTLIR